MNNAQLVRLSLVLRMAALGACLLVSTVGVDAAGVYYIDYSAGSDAAAGTAKATAWKRAPYMKGFVGSYSHSAGDRFIFKGGVTWPVDCFQMLITAGGSSDAIRDVYNTDATWYTGGSFTKPTFDFNHTLVGPGWTMAAGILVQASYITIQGIDILRYRAPRNGLGISEWGSRAITLNNASYVTLDGCTIGDFDQPTSGGSGEWFGGGAFMRVNAGTDNMMTNCVVHQDNITQKSGTGCWNIAIVANTEFRNLPQCVMSAQLIHDNNVHDIPDPTDPIAHSNVFYSNNNATVYNNIIHDVGGRAQVLYGSPGLSTAGTFIYYNNVVWNTAVFPISIETGDQYSSSATVRVYNNTLVGSGVQAVRIVPLRAGSYMTPLGTLIAQNNHFIVNNGAFAIGGGDGPVNNFQHGSNLTNTTVEATANNYVIANSFAPSSTGSASFNTGTNLSGYLSTDILAVARPQATLWDIGAYEFVTATGVPGTIVMTVGTVSVLENAVSLVLDVARTSGASGIVGCSYNTADDTALAGVNYTTSSGTLSWANGDDANKTITIPLISVPFYGSKRFTVTLSSATGGASLGEPVITTVTIIGVGAAPINLLSGTTWTNASSVNTPFTSNATYYAQSYQTTDPSQAGIADYYFTVSTNGTYNVYATVYSPSDAENSLFFATSTNVIVPDNVWDTPTNSVATEYPMTLRGSSNTFPSVVPVQVYLSTGVTNHFQVRGREANTRVYSLRIGLVAEPPPVVPPAILSTSFITVDGYYKAMSNILAVITGSTNLFVTEAPIITNNVGDYFIYDSGSGSTNLTFIYTVLSGQNIQSLDYAATNSLSLNGGTIKDASGTDAVLTLPVPGSVGSLSYNRAVVIDTLAPTVTIGGPSVTTTLTNSTVFYTITYGDTNFYLNTLVATNVTLNGTTTGTITTGPNSTGPNTAVRVDNLTIGSGSISLVAGTAIDLAGNLAPAVGPSPSFIVTNAFGGTANVIMTAGGIISIRPKVP